MVEEPNLDARVLVITTFHKDKVQGEIGVGVAELLEQKVDTAQFDEIEFIISNKIELFWSGRELGTYDKIIMYGGVGRLLRIAYPLAASLKSRGIDVMTSGAENFVGLDKLSQNVFFSLHNIPIPKTYFANPKIMLERAKDIIGFPLIIKDILASRGENNFLVSNQAELENHLRELEADRYVAQEYIENDGDIRVLISANHKTYAFKRSSTNGSHINNTSAGGRAKALTNPSEKIISFCKTIIDSKKAPILGIDVIDSAGEYYFLEANIQPMIFTGALTDEKKVFFRDALNTKYPTLIDK